MKPIDPILLTQIFTIVQWGEVSFGIITVRGKNHTDQGWKKKLWSPDILAFAKQGIKAPDKNIAAKNGAILLRRKHEAAFTPIPPEKIFLIKNEYLMRVSQAGNLYLDSEKTAVDILAAFREGRTPHGTVFGFPLLRINKNYKGSFVKVLEFEGEDYKVLSPDKTELGYRKIRPVTTAKPFASTPRPPVNKFVF